MKFYLYHRDHPGNPWGPFETREEAYAFKFDLLAFFTGPYTIRKSH